MQILNDFKFTLNLSREFYKDKTESNACLSEYGAKAIGRNKMAFDKKTLTVDEFLDYTVNGYCYCHNYEFEDNKKYPITLKNHKVVYAYPTYRNGENKGALKLSFKKDEYFTSTQVIFVDIDKTKYTTVQEYIDNLNIKPTCVYMSYSDNKEKKGEISRRFHLIYIFNDRLTKEQFQEASTLLNYAVEVDTGEKLDDDCGTRLSQYLNGCYGNNEKYNSNIIYSYNDIIYYNNIYNIIKGEEEVHTYYNECQNDYKIIPQVSDNLISDMERLDYDEFMKYNRHKYPYIYRKEKEEWIDGLYQFIDDDYFSLYYNSKSLKDGEKRRKKLFERMCLRRIINPDIDPDTLLFNAYEDVHRFFDNSDGVLNIGCLVKNVENAMTLSIDDIKEHYSRNIEFYKSRRPKSGIIIKRNIAHSIAERNTKIKNIRWKLISDYYDPNKDIDENIEIIKDNLFDITKRTLYRYCKENNIKPTKNKLNDNELIQILDINLTVRDNHQLLKDSDIKVGIKRVNKLLNEKRSLVA